ncbi:hypothetical protein BKA62DRAFT_654758 [Auriculariales sp. MPI-PUGE-AT-0066]|nr:hypothetical protein BKA62DRAFT_654758 [Auriculariales sp. MPI-PUGE-AT-0066]
MSGGLVPYNFTLPPIAGVWQYSPYKQAAADVGWNASFTNSPQWPDPMSLSGNGNGVSYFRTQVSEAQVSLNFQGSGVFFCYTDNGAQVALTLDGSVSTLKTAPGGSDPACQSTGASTVAYASGLAVGPHTAVVRVAASASHEFQFFGGMLTSVIPTNGAVGSTANIAEKWIDDTDPSWTYQPPVGAPNWDPTGTGQNLYNLTTTFTCMYSQGNLTTRSFTGAGAAVLYGNAWRDSHDFTVELQGGGLSETTSSDMSTTGWNMGQQVVWLRANLDPEQTYTITYRNWNPSNPECRGFIPAGGVRYCCASIDALKLLSIEVTGAPPPSTSNSPQNPTQTTASNKSSNLGAILGGVCGGLALALAIAVLVFFLLRRRRRQDQEDYTVARSYTSPAPAQWATSSVPATYGSSPQAWSPMPTGSTSQPSSHGALGQPYFGGRSSVAPSSITRESQQPPNSAGPAPLAQSDLHRVLEYVRGQMDSRPTRTDHEDDTGTVLPPYSYRAGD